MIKIWGKIVVNSKIVKQSTTLVEETNTSFFDMLKNVCHNLNIPTPVLLDKHVYDFNMFHLCTFKADDFVESIIFDRFEISLLPEHHK